MNYVVKTLPAAEEDALEGAIWYDQRAVGLGDDFLDEVDSTVRRLAETALIYRVRFADVRRAPVTRFKYYGVYYVIRTHEVLVLAIYHGRRHPRWLEQRRKTIKEPAS
jgi:plasmid stabilization system protein ParE